MRDATGWVRQVSAAVVVGAVALAACANTDERPAANTPPSTEATASTTTVLSTTQARAQPTTAAGWTDDAGTTVRFADVTAASGVDLVFDSALVSDGDKDTRIMMGGVAAADYDNDGDTDLFALGGGNALDQLLINDGSGSFTDVAQAAGLSEPHLGAGVAAGDYDSDGDIDLYVTSHGPLLDDPTTQNGVTGAHRLYRNNGDLTFTDVAAEAGVATTSTVIADGFGAVFGDADLDGDLDLFVAGWHRDGKGNRLFENLGDGTFADITDAAGIVDDGVRGFAPCFADTDGDRYPEIMLVADFGTTRFYANNGGGRLSFTESIAEVGGGVEWSGMGTAVGDVDNDGLLDWYVTAIADSEGNGRGTGNALYVNSGDGTFAEIAQEAGVNDGDWGWGALLVDVNHDGHLDIFETNGWDFPAYIGNPSYMWISNGSTDPGSLAFTDVAAEAGPIHDLHGLGVAQLDLEGDGDRDIVVTASNDELRLYRNDLDGTAANWLRIELDTSATDGLAPNGIGSTIRVTANGDTQMRTIGNCSNYNSTSELTAHVGVADATVVDLVVVEWADGTTTELSNVDVNQRVTISPLS